MTAPQGLGYLLKDRVGDLEDLVRALQEVASGGSVVDPLIIDTLVARQQTRPSSPLASLTPRELDVLREMAQGKTNAGIEQALFLSESTWRSTSTRSSPSWASRLHPSIVGSSPYSRSSRTLRRPTGLTALARAHDS